LWSAYREFMSRQFSVSENLGVGGAAVPGIAASATKRFFDAFVSSAFQPKNTLSGASALPASLQNRIELMTTMEASGSAFLAPPGPGRDSSVAEAISMWQTAGTRPGWWGAVARLQALILVKRHQPAAYPSLLASLSQDELVMDVARSQVSAGLAAGLDLGEAVYIPGPHGVRRKQQSPDSK